MLVPSQLKAHPIGKYLSVIQNDAVKLNGDIINRLETSPLQHPPSDYPNLGPTTKRYWGKVSFRNPSPNRKDIYLEYKYPAYTLEIYGDKNYRQPLFSYSERKTENPMNHRFPLFRLTLEPGLNDYYFSLTSSSAAFNFQVWTPELFASYQYQDQFLIGYFFGAVVIIIAYNTLMLAMLRKKMFLYYVLYLIGVWGTEATNLALSVCSSTCSGNAAGR